MILYVFLNDFPVGKWEIFRYDFFVVEFMIFLWWNLWFTFTWFGRKKWKTHKILIIKKRKKNKIIIMIIISQKIWFLWCLWLLMFFFWLFYDFYVFLMIFRILFFNIVFMIFYDCFNDFLRFFIALWIIKSQKNSAKNKNKTVKNKNKNASTKKTLNPSHFFIKKQKIQVINLIILKSWKKNKNRIIFNIRLPCYL